MNLNTELTLAKFKKTTPGFDNPSALDQNLYGPPQAVGLEFGCMLILIALMGLFDPGFLGLNLSFMHVLVLGSSGALSAWASFSYPQHLCYRINLSLGLFFLLNAVIGYLVVKLNGAGSSFYSTEQLNRLAPGFSELGFADHLVHTFFSIIFFGEAFSVKYHHLNRSFLKRTFLKYILRTFIVLLVLSLVMAVVSRLRTS
jgi:hypothetical protein